MPNNIFHHRKHRKHRHFPLDIVIDELLHNIQKYVHEKKDLLSLCLVSRRLYTYSIDYLYCDITIDPAAASHRDLLQRLTHKSSSVVQQIRILRLETKWTVHDENFRQMGVLISRMKNPFKFIIHVPLSGPLGAAAFFLYTLHGRFPNALIEIKQGGSSTQNIRNTIHTLTAHPACAQITRLDIDFGSIGNFWPHCKRDLVVIIRSARILEYLHIITPAWMSFPEYLTAFENIEFPKLKELDLGSAENGFFTPRDSRDGATKVAGNDLLS